MVHISVAQARALGLDIGGGAPVSKYKNKRVTVDGITFDSKREAQRWGELCLLVNGGHIYDLEPHPRYPLIVNDVKVGVYVADFRYRDKNRGDVLIVEDVKSKPTMTPVYRLKRKLMFALFGIDVQEIMTTGGHKKGRR